MRRSSQSNDNRFYAYLPPSGYTTPRNASSQSTNRNDHYHYYDSRVRHQQQTQQNLYEYQFSGRGSRNVPPLNFASPRNQFDFSSSSFLLQDFSSIPHDNIADLGEPISIFDEVRTFEPRRPIVVPSLPPPSYVPPDPTRRSSTSEVRLATAHVLRDQLLNDIERSMTEIDRDLTSLERRPSVPRYVPPRFSPIAENDNQEVKPYRQGTFHAKPPSVMSRAALLTVVQSPLQNMSKQNSAHSSIPDRHSGMSQYWPNKPKRVYEVIPRLTSDSVRTSRQSSFTAQPDEHKLPEIPTNEQPIRMREKSTASSDRPIFKGEYRYAPEVGEKQIQEKDPENIDRQSKVDNMLTNRTHETLHGNDFIRSLSQNSQHRAIITIPEIMRADSAATRETHDDVFMPNPTDEKTTRIPIGQPTIVPKSRPKSPEKYFQPRETPQDYEQTDELENPTSIKIASKTPEPVLLTPLKRSPSPKTTTLLRPVHSPSPKSTPSIRSARSSSPKPTKLTRSARSSSPEPTTLVHSVRSPSPEPTNMFVPSKSRVDSGFHLRVPSRSNETPITLYHKTEDYFENDEEPIAIKVPTEADRNSLKSPIVPLDIPERSPTPRLQRQKHAVPDTAPHQTLEERKKGDETDFFSGFDNDPEEDLLSITQSNFKVPTDGHRFHDDDDTMSRQMKQSEVSYPVRRSPIKFDRPDSNSMDPVTFQSDDEQSRKEKENFFEYDENGMTNEEIPAMTSIPTFSPSTKQPFSISIMDDRQLQSASRKSSSVKDALSNNDNEDAEQSRRTPMADSNQFYRPKSTPRFTEKDERQTNDSPDFIQSQPQYSRQVFSRPQSNNSEQSKQLFDRKQSGKSVVKLEKEDRMYMPDIEHIKRESTNSSMDRPISSHRMKQTERITSTTPDGQSFLNDFRATRAVSTERSISRDSLPQSAHQKLTPILRKSPNNQESQHFETTDPQTLITRTHNDNEPHPFSVSSEHFLRDKTQTPFDGKKRLPTTYSPNEQRSPSSQSDEQHSPLPIILDSPELDNEPPPTSRTATPKQKQSATIIENPPDPRIILTTSDEPDPDDPSIINSTIHFRMAPMSFEPRTRQNFISDSPIPQSQRPPISMENPHFLVINDDPHSNDQLVPSPSPPLPVPLFENHIRIEELMLSSPSPLERIDRISTPIITEQPAHSISPTESLKEQNIDEHPDHRTPSEFLIHHERYPSDSLELKEPVHLNYDNDHDDDDVLIKNDGREFFSDPNYSSPVVPATPVEIVEVQPTTIPRRKSGKEPTFITEQQRNPSSERSVSPSNSPGRRGHLSRDDIPLNSASIKTKNRRSPTRRDSTDNDDDIPYATGSQKLSRLSLKMKTIESKPRKTIQRSASPIRQDETEINSSFHQEESMHEEPTRSHRRRRVSFTQGAKHFQMEERQLLSNWRERVADILAKKHDPHDKYAHVSSKVNSFANFEYQPRKIKNLPKRQNRSTNRLEENQFEKRKRFKSKKSKKKFETSGDDATDEDGLDPTQAAKEKAPQIFGRLWCLPDGSPTVFHESLEWNVQSRLKAYSYENFNYERQRDNIRKKKLHRKKKKWHSETKLSEIQKENFHSFRRKNFSQSTPRLIIEEDDSENLPFLDRSDKERKIFDIKTNRKRQINDQFPINILDNGSIRSFSPKNSQVQNGTENDRSKDGTSSNEDSQSKKPNAQIFQKSVHWNSEPKVRTRSPSTENISRTSSGRIRIFDEKLNWDARAKVHCWSEVDLRQVSRKKSIFAQHRDPKWNDLVTSRIDSRNYQYLNRSHQLETNDRRQYQTTDQDSDKSTSDPRNSSMFVPEFRRLNTPPNRPRWNAVSKKSSVNSIYNPRINESNTIRRTWDRELRRKRVQKLPPLKRKRDHEDHPTLAIEPPPATLVTNNQLAIEYNYDRVSTRQGRTTSNGYMTTSSRRSSKALVPINHFRYTSDNDLPAETPRSQRPVQQEWYEEMTKSRMTQRTEGERAQTTRSFRLSIDSLHHPHTPRDLVTFRSSTRNSQNSVMSGTLLDSTIRSNRATELRLLKDMEEHHHHSHAPSQSMPIEVRGFSLEGTPLIVPDHATIRPLSNVNYQASERVKNRRVYPWSNLHPLGTSSRNSSLVPIAELRRPSLDTTITEAQQLITEE